MKGCNITKKNAGFCIHFDEINENIAMNYVQRIEVVYQEMNEIYDFDDFLSEKEIDIYLCNDVESYLYHTGKKPEDYQNWMVGWAEGYKICILTPDASCNTYDYILSVLVHEVIHVIFDENLGLQSPIWLAEGIAILHSDQTCDKYIEIDNPCLIADISNENEEFFAEKGGYDYAGIYVWQFIQKYGVEVFKKVYTGEMDFLNYIDENYEYEAICKWFQKG